MKTSGRTMRQAINDGTGFELQFRTADRGHWAGEYFPCACETPQEVVDAFNSRWRAEKNRTAQIVRHLAGSQIGCSMVEHVADCAIDANGRVSIGGAR